jgi:hypothetical protein
MCYNKDDENIWISNHEMTLGLGVVERTMGSKIFLIEKLTLDAHISLKHLS